MNLHEYQGKALFAEYNLPVSKGKVIFHPEDAIDACNEIGGSKWVELKSMLEVEVNLEVLS